MFLGHVHIGKPGRAPSLKVDAPPDARIGKHRPPVPAELAVGLAEITRSRHVPGIDILHRAVLVGFGGILAGGKKRHPDGIFPGFKQFLYVKAPGTVHVVHPGKGTAVDENLPQGVNAQAHQFHPVFRQQFSVHGKGAGILKVIFKQRRYALFIFAVIGIVCQARPDPRVKDAPRHIRGKGLLARPFQGPAAVKIEACHQPLTAPAATPRVICFLNMM